MGKYLAGLFLQSDLISSRVDVTVKDRYCGGVLKQQICYFFQKDANYGNDSITES